MWSVGTARERSASRSTPAKKKRARSHIVFPDAANAVHPSTSDPLFPSGAKRVGDVAARKN